MTTLDLNLLATFEALYETRNTTRAADRLALTQSAVSHALGRLRRAVGDPLFVRGPGGLHPTARAIEMAPAVREGLARLREALAPQGFDPGTAQRTLTLATGSYFCTLIAPGLIAWAREVAPDVHIRLVPYAQDLPAALDDGSIDLAVGVFDKVPARFATADLFEDTFVWVAAKGHPLAACTVTTAEIAAAEHLLVGTAVPFGIPSQILAAGGIEVRAVADLSGALAVTDSRMGAVVYDVLTALAVVGATDLVARVPRRMAEGPGRALGVAVLDTEEPQGGFAISAIWHSRASSDGAIRWLVERLKGA